MRALFAFLLLSTPALASPPPLGIVTRCEVVNVVDGDTVDVECRYVVRVRIIDLWCPETRTKNEQEKQQGLLAKRHMKNLAEGQRAVLFVPTASAVSTKDVLTLERTLGHIWLDGDEVSLAEHMIESGYGYKEKPK